MVRFAAAALLLLAVTIGSVLSAAATIRGETSMPQKDGRTGLKITIVYDNTLYVTGLTAGWGLAALVEYAGHVLLFDTGADGQALLSNMASLHIDPPEIEAVVLSHYHSDHIGGLKALLATGVQPDVYLLPSFPASFKRQIGQATTVIEAAPDQVISEGILTTGEMHGDIPEQAIAIEIDQGVVILTGCAHPGVVAVVEYVKNKFGKPVYLVLGGFHLMDKTRTEIAAIVQAFRRLGVEHVGPCHCTGKQATAAFAAEYGDDFLQIGTGKIIEIGASVASPSE
jgi:7,8-dihydropterin-6-yl-methyl-4-(beta-D-ribofuranosyl)aminobenzene 5'-phosphate synthase